MIETLRRNMMIQQDKTPIPETNQVVYKSRNGEIIDLSRMCNGTLLSTEISGEYFIATFDRDITTIKQRWYNSNIGYIDLPHTCQVFEKAAFD